MIDLGKYLKSNKVLFVLATGLMVASCSVEKNTNMSRFYHNLTSNYNIYFNANEAFQDGVNRIEDAYVDDYSMLIPVFEYSDDNAARAGTGDMDRAIQKASKLISLHSMTAKPEMDNNATLSDKEQEFYDRKEYNNWVDDSYLLMGKAQLYKNELDTLSVSYVRCRRLDKALIVILPLNRLANSASLYKAIPLLAAVVFPVPLSPIKTIY